jgi:undecaprenyl-diphosphatase
VLSSFIVRKKTAIIIVSMFVFAAALAVAQTTGAGASSDSTQSVPELKPAVISDSAAVSQTTMSLPQALVLGAVEGITEFLPISSTGHLLVAERLLGIGKTGQARDAADAYAICIQLGAILAVFLVSFGRIKAMVSGIFGRNPQGLKLAGNLVVAFIPAAVIGFVLEDKIKQYLYGPWYIAVAWVVGGLFILLAMRKKGSEGGLALEGLTWQTALIIGLAQCAALWPGVSRSLATIAGGMLLGLSVSATVEFSFLLGLATLGAATIYEGIKRGPEIIALFGWVNPLIGIAAAAVTAFIAVRWMISYLKNNSPMIFGWYRIGIGIFVAALALRGVL